MELLTLGDFAPLVGSTVRLRREGADPLALRLEKVTDLARGPIRPEGRAPFSVWFVGPAQPRLPQMTYALDCGPLGTRDVFLVPIAAVPDGIRYEAVFN